MRKANYIMRKEQTELFSSNLEEIPQEELHFSGLIIHQQIDPLAIFLEEKIIRGNIYNFREFSKGRKNKHLK